MLVTFFIVKLVILVIARRFCNGLNRFRRKRSADAAPAEKFENVAQQMRAADARRVVG